jgi:hypothetical protein
VFFDAESEYVAVGVRTKQLILLASDVLLAALRRAESNTAEVVNQLISGRVLPSCYEDRYDRRFVRQFHNVVELTRNSVVGDLPHLANTAEELAGLAIFARCQSILDEGGAGTQDLAAAIDQELSGQLATDRAQIGGEIDSLAAILLEDGDVLTLFDLEPGREPQGEALLRFDHWLVPFGNPPRPHIAADGRAWPA